MKDDGKRKEKKDKRVERIERKRGEMGGTESEENEREIVATADTPDMCPRLAPVRTDRRKTGLSIALECDRRWCASTQPNGGRIHHTSSAVMYQCTVVIGERTTYR
jgi:hypothetical protein